MHLVHGSGLAEEARLWITLGPFPESAFAMPRFSELPLLPAAALAITAAALPDRAPAQSFVIAGSAGQYADNASASGLGLELLGAERYRIGTLRFGLSAATSLDSEQNFWIGAGLAFVLPTAGRWYVEGSVMPGYYRAGSREYDLGDTLEVRSLIGLGYEFNDSYSLSLGLSHMSNGGLGSTNPGSNALSLRLRARL